MLRRFIPALGLALLLPACVDTSDPIDPQMSLVDIQNKPADATLYRVFKGVQGFTWTQAYYDALEAKVRGKSGGHLVTISSQAENSIVAALVAKAPGPCWIGLRQFGTAFYEPLGNWYWAVLGDPALAAWTNWAAGEPNHMGYSAAAVNDDGTWLDAAYAPFITDQGDTYNCYVVEIDP